MTKPLVSIITPTYNHEIFIRACIESVLKQTYQNWEMIVVDDASTDKTPYILDEYARSDGRIKLVRHISNWGIRKLVDTYNQALGMAKGEYIAILEGDDFWPLDKLEKQIDIMVNNPNKILSYGLIGYVKDNKIINSKNDYPEEIKNNIPVGSSLKVFLLGSENYIHSQTVIIKKNSLLKINGFKPSKNIVLSVIDYPTWMELALQGEFLFISEVLGFWRKHKTQVTNVYAERFPKEVLKYNSYFIRNKKNALSVLSVDLYKYITNYGYDALFALCKKKVMDNDLKNSKRLLKHIFRRKGILSCREGKFREGIKLMVLAVSVEFPVVYRFIEYFYDNIVIGQDV
jgi:glycosyltransferase involved in cell wall biosynthesis